MKTILLIGMFGLSACASVPQVKIDEAEYSLLQYRIRDLERENDKLKTDLSAERGENLKAREYLRRVEHPLTAREEREQAAERNNCGVPEVWMEYGGKLVNINNLERGDK